MEFKDKLKCLRKSSNMTQQKVADILGIDRSTYSFYELGKTRPKLDILKDIAKLFKTTVDFLLADEIDSGIENLVSSPKLFEEYSFDDKFNDLSDFEKAVVFKTRLMSAAQKKKLMEFLSDGESLNF